MQTQFNTPARNCEWCSQEFHPWPSQLNKVGWGRFCSPKCLGEWVKRPEATRPRLIANSRLVGDCLLWTGRVTRFGYGMVRSEGKEKRVHRVAWELATGEPIPTGKTICHTCDNRICFQTEGEGVWVVDGVEYPRRGHLFLGDLAVNLRDMWSKGRGKLVPTEHRRPIRQEDRPFGEAHWKSMFTPDQVREIRLLSKGGMGQRTIAKRYGCSRTAIVCILKGKTWVHVK